MNIDDIIRMAREAGMQYREHLSEVATPYCDGVYMDELERFAALVAAAEREECAKVLDEMAAADKLSNYYKVAALWIRERGNHD
jgi:hypothetical protein